MVYRVTYDRDGRVGHLEFEAKDDDHARTAFVVARNLGRRFGAERFRLEDRRGRHVDGWRGLLLTRKKEGELPLDE